MKVGDLVKFVPGHTGHNPYPKAIGVVTGRDIEGVFVFWSVYGDTRLMNINRIEVVNESR